MPLPKPNIGEEKEQFISRCMSDNIMNTEYDDDKQRYAICAGLWGGKEPKAEKAKLDLVPPKKAQSNAQKVLDWKDEHGDDVNGMTRVGWTRARQLASGQELSKDIVKRMAQFNRHRKNGKLDPDLKSTPWKDAGYVAWLGWGGTEGIDWALRMSEKINNEKSYESLMAFMEYKFNPEESKPKIKQDDREVKSFGFELKNYDEDEEYFTFKGYASTFGNVDRGNDTIAKGAFTKTLMQRNPKLLFQHQMSEPIGVIDKAVEDDYGLYVEGKMPKDDMLVKGRVIPQMKIGSLVTMSIGFIAKETEYVEKENERYRIIKECELFEVSLVTEPMNEMAKVTDMKSYSMDDVLDIESKKDFEKILRDSGAFSRKACTYLASKFNPNQSESAEDISQQSESVELQVNNFINQIKNLTQTLEKKHD